MAFSYSKRCYRWSRSLAWFHGSEEHQVIQETLTILGAFYCIGYCWCFRFCHVTIRNQMSTAQVVLCCKVRIETTAGTCRHPFRLSKCPSEVSGSAIPTRAFFGTWALQGLGPQAYFAGHEVQESCQRMGSLDSTCSTT